MSGNHVRITFPEGTGAWGAIRPHGFPRWFGIGILSVAILLAPICRQVVIAGEILPVGLFSTIDIDSGDKAETLPHGWEPMAFRNIHAHTRYTLVREDNRTVIRAESRASASGLIRHIRIDPKAYPVIRWRWKTTGVYEKGNVTRKDGDDYPVRIYIAFEYDPSRIGFFEKVKFETIRMIYGAYPPSRAINYIWDNRTPVGTKVPNPFTNRVMMMVVASGDADSNAWMTVERNLYQDYLECFGEPPPMISGVGIMTDSDNTGESTVSYYGDIEFVARNESP